MVGIHFRDCNTWPWACNLTFVIISDMKDLTNLVTKRSRYSQKWVLTKQPDRAQSHHLGNFEEENRMSQQKEYIVPYMFEQSDYSQRFARALRGWLFHQIAPCNDIRLGNRKSMDCSITVIGPTPVIASAASAADAIATIFWMKTNLGSTSLIIFAETPCGSQYFACTVSETELTGLGKVINIESVQVKLS